MPSLSDDPTRHVIVDRREGHYLAFPDVVRADNGRLIVAYNEADKHVRPERRVLVVRTSDDTGQTWSDPIYPDSSRSHSPRLLSLADGKLLISDSSAIFHTSTDNGDTWLPFKAEGLFNDMHDRVMILPDNSWLTTGHAHEGDEEHPAIRQPPTKQLMFRSTNQGNDWENFAVLAFHRNLTLCEASMIRLPDTRILALMRENSFVYEPMYASLSGDNGATWSPPISTPLIGHRPTMGQISDGRLLVTYRNTGPDWGTSAWLGTLDELLSGFRVHGRAVSSGNPTFTPEGMRVRNGEADLSVVRYALRPLTDPRTATATLEATVRVDHADENGCAIRFGVWWKLYPDFIAPDQKDAPTIPIEPGQFNRIRLEYEKGEITLFVNGEERATIKVDEDHAETRPILFGAPYPFEYNEVDCTWQSVSLKISEPAYDREYAWQWTHKEGVPDQWAQKNILELRNGRETAAPDFGYSGWCEPDNGKFFVVYHHSDGTAWDYDPLYSSHIAGTWFSLDDFK